MTKRHVSGTPSKREEYALPMDLVAKWDLYVGCQDIRDRYVSLRWFGFNPAMKAAAQSEHWRNEFWAGVYKLYPKLNGKTIEYDRYNKIVFVKDTK